MAGPIVRESIVDIVAKRLRQEIIDGRIEAGAQLSEGEIAAQFGVSRGPTREAIQRLLQEGLAYSVPYKGVYLIDLNHEDVSDLYVAREAIEVGAIRIICAASSQADLSGLDVILRDMELAAKDLRWGALARLDLQFHDKLVNLAESRRLERMFSTLIVETAMCMHAVERAYPEKLDLVDEHRRVLNTLKTGDCEASQLAVSNHLRDAVALVVSAKSKAPSGFEG